MLASLPMYDRPEIATATNRLWDSIRDTMRQMGMTAPDRLTRAGNLWDHWRAPDLVLSQTCGLPYRSVLHEITTMIGTPDYGLPDCPPGHYNSVILVRRDETRTDPSDWPQLRLAFNELHSQSGWAAALNHAQSLGTTFGEMIETGAHRASVRMVAEGRADICVCDAQTWRLIRRWDRYEPALREIGRTEPTPGLPLITARAEDAERIGTAVRHALALQSAEDRTAMGLNGFVKLPKAAYLAVPTPPAP
ncbi:PhnD/SsuA/transferrin family substrate-binding protein [Pseudooceanicola sp. 216_PA32_1]|uniref:PhnD/SsuA/transferrin family substrate-binding protein n=1 Tax=Pseudooceanicola pacificus TaxID=2676438 RepID=A0A844W3E4_9RHOB|nr:PhnD/SsuA/transferrin family substrate-binding protein [Pseudooceanicola pacificus]MWB77595.1 PhnD/SsuA/transferrin family substrate-binding protein [Pseudooceanicola pacificus]